jgi:hypothetical protein
MTNQILLLNVHKHPLLLCCWQGNHQPRVHGFNPKTHDLVATSPSTNTIQSWNINQAQDAIERSGGFLYGADQLSAGIDYAQSALTNNGSKLYIVNPTLNAIRVENLSRPF